MNKRRHKWQQVGHAYHHTKECINCGCIKDASNLFNTIYYFDKAGERTFTAPECKKQESNAQS